MSVRQTSMGYVKLSNLEDVFVMIGKNQGIDTIKFYSEFPPGSIYIALWSGKLTQGFGGCMISTGDFKQLRSIMGDRLAFIESGDLVTP